MSNENKVAQCDIVTFEKWINQLGGCERVARINEVHKSTLHRYCNGAEELPKLWINFMNQSKELAELKQNEANSRRRK